MSFGNEHLFPQHAYHVVKTLSQQFSRGVLSGEIFFL